MLTFTVNVNCLQIKLLSAYQHFQRMEKLKKHQEMWQNAWKVFKLQINPECWENLKMFAKNINGNVATTFTCNKKISLTRDGSVKNV